MKMTLFGAGAAGIPLLLTVRSRYSNLHPMARPKEFDVDVALAAAVAVFQEHGYEGTSATMLVDSMAIGRQSVYDTFGDKWQLYLAAIRRYSLHETSAHIAALKRWPKAADGIKAAVERIVREARSGCLGVNSICEFGSRSAELNEIHAAADRPLRAAFTERIREAQAAGDISSDLTPNVIVDFLWASFAGIRVAARGGATDKQLRALGQLTLRALA
jgi:TetR/AcrR family transcriptional repressor of nem operon